MNTLDYIGLDVQEVKKVTNELQQLLADLQVFTMNVHARHWHIQGVSFFDLHEKYDEMYSALNETIDEVAERILALGDVPESRFSVYLKKSPIKEDENTATAEATVTATLNDLKHLIAQMQKVYDAGEGIDPVTQDMTNGYIQEQQKNVWMLVAFLKK